MNEPLKSSLKRPMSTLRGKSRVDEDIWIQELRYRINSNKLLQDVCKRVVNNIPPMRTPRPAKDSSLRRQQSRLAVSLPDISASDWSLPSREPCGTPTVAQTKQLTATPTSQPSYSSFQSSESREPDGVMSSENSLLESFAFDDEDEPSDCIYLKQPEVALEDEIISDRKAVGSMRWWGLKEQGYLKAHLGMKWNAKKAAELNRRAVEAEEKEKSRREAARRWTQGRDCNTGELVDHLSDSGYGERGPERCSRRESNGDGSNGTCELHEELGHRQFHRPERRSTGDGWHNHHHQHGIRDRRDGGSWRDGRPGRRNSFGDHEWDYNRRGDHIRRDHRGRKRSRSRSKEKEWSRDRLRRQYSWEQDRDRVERWDSRGRSTRM